MKRILVALDGSKNALNAVKFAGNRLGFGDDAEIVLFHVLPFAPSRFWDDGHILSNDERTARKDVVDKWMAEQTSRAQPIFSAALSILEDAGVKPERIATKWTSDSQDVSGSICEEARDGNYHALIIGRRGHSDPRDRIGATSGKVIHLGTGIPICLVD